MKTASVSLVVVMFIYFMFTAISFAAEPNFPICTSGGDQVLPAVSNGNVVWMDKAYSKNYNIYRNDPGNLDGIPVCDASGHQKNPAISGNIIVWQDHYSSPSYIYRSDTGMPVYSDAGAKQENPAISGTTIVWQEDRGNGWDIYGYDPAKADPNLVICTDSNSQCNPAISDTMVVWQDSQNTSTDIYCYDLDAEQEFTVCTDANTQQFPAISGDIIVWEDYRNGTSNADIYGYSISARTEFPICTVAFHQKSPAIDGDFVVWEDQRRGGELGDIYGCRVSTRTTFVIFKGVSDQKNPAIGGNMVVWEDYRDGSSDIYGADIPDISTVTKILSPNGGGKLIAGKQCALQWTSNHLADGNYVKLEYSANNGESFSIIDANAPNTGLYTWPMPQDIDSNQCLIRISDKDNPDTTDASDNIFTIFQCDASLTADLSGDCKVDFEDFAILSSQWLRCGIPGQCP